jgi:hypothetical protein
MNDKKVKVESWTYVDGKLVAHNFEEKNVVLIEDTDSIIQDMQENIGIGFLHPSYIEIAQGQNKSEEYKNISNFLNTFLNKYAEQFNLSIKDLTLEFINYGKTELVYVLKEKSGNRVTLLVKQPAVPFGKIKQEAQYLKDLQKIGENIVAPLDYFSIDNQELYITPYITQARCVASDNSWGMYIPEPFYRFESFTQKKESLVNICMIAKLVSLYDFKKQEGICACKLGGGDFMLAKGWEKEEPTLENTLNNLYLIAAREKINCPFNKYLDIIRKEFSKATINEKKENSIINIRGRVAMKPDDIEKGIRLGLLMIENRKNSRLSSNNKKTI